MIPTRKYRIGAYSLLLVVACYQLYRTCLYGPAVVTVLQQPLPAFTNRHFIAHALGAIRGHHYTNSMEAFDASYRAGFRVFEVDLELLSDRTLVCFHRGSESSLGLEDSIDELNFERFKAAKYFGEIPTLDARTLFTRISQLPDVELILDTKGDFRTVITETTRVAAEISPNLTSRFVPQIYGNGSDDLRVALELNRFRYVLYSLYKGGGTERRVLDFVRANRISGIVAADGSRSAEFVQALNKVEVPVFIHPVNDPKRATELFGSGIAGVFTADLSPALF